MNLLCTGINHRTAPLKIREKLWFSAEETGAFISTVRKQATECVLTSTCNRTELYYIPNEHAASSEPMWMLLAQRKNAGNVVRESHFYTMTSLNAVKHLYNVASGIDSMILGDVQILSQLKESFALAQEIGSTGVLLNRLFTNALHVGKRARTETEIGEGAVSISFAAAELASKIFDDLAKRTVLLVGTGETGKLAAQHLASRSVGKFLLANRTYQRAEELAIRLNGSAVDFDRLCEHIASVDIIITAVESPVYVLTADQIRSTQKQRGKRPLFIIDLGVPRNVDPLVNTIDSVFLHDIDALTHIVDTNLAHRQEQVPRIEEIVLDELAHFSSWYQSLQVTPTIQQLSEQFEAIRTAEVSKHRHHFATENQEEIELLTKRIVNKILHTPIVNLKNGSADPGANTVQQKISLLRHLFGLDKNGSK